MIVQAVVAENPSVPFRPKRGGDLPAPPQALSPPAGPTAAPPTPPTMTTEAAAEKIRRSRDAAVLRRATKKAEAAAASAQLAAARAHPAAGAALRHAGHLAAWQSGSSCKRHHFVQQRLPADASESRPLALGANACEVLGCSVGPFSGRFEPPGVSRTSSERSQRCGSDGSNEKLASVVTSEMCGPFSPS